MSFKPLALPALLVVSLSACQAQTPPPEPSPGAATMEPNCGADQLGSYVGRQASDEVLAAITAARSGHAVRIIRPGTVVTQDYRPDRLNVTVDESGTITALRCS
ncbi:I78 family peptidase inhibitor [Novosphingobium soli]|uniref:I78 family peptidase inhibitor n=1 Tax=Novosphingobium soli TaxID=574956 RepID=A0ABV6CSS6_9SPHN